MLQHIFILQLLSFGMFKGSFHDKKFDTLQILFQMLKKIYLNAQNGSIVFFPCLLEKVFKFSKFFHELFPYSITLVL